jgi:hypothetical protein
VSFLIRSVRGGGSPSEGGTGSSDSPARDVSDQPLRSGLIARCANPECRSGWIHLFRSRSTPVFEGGWTCSPACTEIWIRSALERELAGHAGLRGGYRHRNPLGLLMLEQGWITPAQLREALDAQKEAGKGRLGEVLIRLRAADELTVTRALGIQWSCPVLSVASAAPSAITAVVPRVLIQSAGALPLRVVAGKLLYLGFEANLDPVFALALERISGLRVESGIVPSSAFRAFQAKVLGWQFPPIELNDAGSLASAAILFSRAVEQAQPAASRLVRVHSRLWLRMVLEDVRLPSLNLIRDVVCSIGRI